MEEKSRKRGAGAVDLLISPVAKQRMKKEKERSISTVDDVEGSDNCGFKMMVKMGYNVGEGLGAQNQGRKEPVVASTHSNRQGLGLTVEDLGMETPDTVWVPGADEASARGDIVISMKDVDMDEVVTNMVEGDRIVSIDDQCRFCDPDLLKEMVKCKTMLDLHKSILDGRSRSNPYEKIGSAIFLNRAAVKMANLNYLFQGLFTSTPPGQILYFADICAGPGGFTEYMLWKRPLSSCGFGFTLKDSCDFKLKDILCGPVECFYPSYGSHDDGDIFVEDNLRRFQQEVLTSTDGVGVHSVLADGGFSVEGNENMQEILSKQLYLCQFLCAINILRVGGNFVCKLFDTFTDFSVGLIFIMSTLFHKVSIVKPITSRPANSERYIIFEDLVSCDHRVQSTRDFLYEVNRRLVELKDTESDVLKLMSSKTLKNDEDFFQFIREANDRIMAQQIVALAKMHAFVLDRNLVDDRQVDIRSEALRLWNVPDVGRDIFKATKAPQIVYKFVNIDDLYSFEGLNMSAKKSVKSLKEAEFVKDKFVLKNHVAGFISRTVGELERHSLYVLIKDKRLVRWYPDSTDRRPEKLTEVVRKWSPSLPSFTIMLVHFGTEFSGEKGNIKYHSITVVDSPLIYGEDISSLPYEKRMDRVKNLCKLLDPKHKGNIKPLDFFPLSTIFDYLRDRLSFKKAKGVKEQEMITISKGDHFFPPWKVIIINVVREPWMVAVSKSTGHTYYYNVNTKQPQQNVPIDLYASYSESSIFEVDWTDQNDSLDHNTFLRLCSGK